MSLAPGAEIALAIEQPAIGGRMIARHDGQVVFVAGTIPGERVRARVERVSKHLAYAETIETLEASPDRRSSGLDWACGGSLYAHISYPRQLSLKSELVADAFKRVGKIALSSPVSMTGSAEHGYRMRARLHAKDGRFGFFREGTHELCEAGPTHQLLPSTIDALQRLQASLVSAGATGVVSCDVSENVAASERAVLVAFDASGPAPTRIEEIDGITGVMFADHRGSRLTVGYGSPYVTDRIDIAGQSATLTHHVQSFFQGNRYLLPGLIARALAQVPEGDVTELYAGVGLFAVALAVSGRAGIIAVEGDRSSAHDLDTNAAPHAQSITVVQSSVELYLQKPGLRKLPTLIVDPPRTGMSREAMSGVLALAPPRVVYVSCDLATVARDIRRFVEVGYTLDHIEAFDLFPNTAHVETLVVLTQKG